MFCNVAKISPAAMSLWSSSHLRGRRGRVSWTAEERTGGARRAGRAHSASGGVGGCHDSAWVIRGKRQMQDWLVASAGMCGPCASRTGQFARVAKACAVIGPAAAAGRAGGRRPTRGRASQAQAPLLLTAVPTTTSPPQHNSKWLPQQSPTWSSPSESCRYAPLSSVVICCPCTPS